MHDFRDHCYRQFSAASVCNYPSNNITVKHYLGTVRLLQPKAKQNSICQHGEYRLPAPNLFFERETYMVYRACKSRARKRGWEQEVHILHVNI